MIWYRQYTLIVGLTQFGIHDLCWRIAESDIFVMPSVTYVDSLHLRYSHTADVVPTLTALAFVTQLGEKCKSTSPRAVQVKNQ
jgi:hypothetical protein